MAPYYTPEWRLSLEDPDAGTGLAYIVSEMLEETVQRLNQAPLNHFLSFLDLIEVKLNPPRPAKSNVLFKLSEGAVDPVHLPAGLLLNAANPDGGDPLIFETERAITATPAKLMEIINVNPERDEIVTAAKDYSNSQTLGLAEELSLFETVSRPNEQEHALFVRHDDLFLVDRPNRFYFTVQVSEKQYSEPELAASLASEHVLWQYPCDGEWRSFDEATSAGNMIILLKKQGGRIEETEHQGEIGRWIKCVLKQRPGQASPLLKKQYEMDKLRIRASHDHVGDPEGIKPNELYANELELIEDGFYPFGEQFGNASMFYLSCEEAFTKRSSRLELTFSATAIPNQLRMAQDPEIKWKFIMRTAELEEKTPPRVRIKQVLWEYWNGTNWDRLSGEENYGSFFEELPEGEEKSFTLKFLCPDNLEPSYVNGKLQYWIRARVIQVDPILSHIVQYMSPWLSKPRLTYSQGTQVQFMPQQLYIRNNIDNQEHTLSARNGGEAYKLFEAIPSLAPAVYLSFLTPPLKGPLHMHIELQQRYTAHHAPPWLEWEALCMENGRLIWTPLKVSDGTEGFTVSGGWQWAGPPSMAQARLFGCERYWIRAVNRDKSLGEAYPRHPIAEGLYLNAVPVRQQVSHERLVAIPADGFAVVHPAAIIEEEVWLDEMLNFSAAEQAALLENEPEQYVAQRDGEGNILRFWVKWKGVASLAESGPDDRHYTPDYAAGALQFGDGLKGKSPSPNQDNTAKVTFKSTFGAVGQVDAGEIKSLQLPVAYVDSVSNMKPSIGGGNTETISQVLRRGPQKLKHRGRAVTSRDVEWIAREAYPQMSKVKCLSNRNGALERSPGSLVVVASPEGGYSNIAQFPELRRTVEAELLQSASNIVTLGGAIKVIEPAYLEISVHATVATHSIEDLVPLEMACAAKLQQFLDSDKGNTTGSGWDIGETLHISLLYSQLHAVKPLLYIDRLYVHVVRIENGFRTECDPARMKEIIHGVVMSGSHKVTAIVASDQ